MHMKVINLETLLGIPKVNKFDTTYASVRFGREFEDFDRQN